MEQGIPKILIIACGKRLSGDDSAALEVLDKLRDVPDLGCELRTCEEGCPPGFLAEIPADTIVMFIDTVTSATDAGTIRCQRLPSTSPQCRHLESAGEVGLGLHKEIELARQSKGAVPRMFLLGIEITEVRPGTKLTEKVKKGVEEIVRNFSRYRKLAQDLT